jgi:uncharacterized protein
MRRCLPLAAAAMAVLAGLSTNVRAQLDPKRSAVTIATASPGGNYFLTGNAICRALQRQGMYLASGDVTLVNCAAMSTGGSIQNVDLLRNRVVEVALVQSDWHHHAFKGTDVFAGRKLEQLRSLVSLNREAFQVLAGRGMQMERWGDLKGKKVNLGPKGSTAHSMFQELFQVHGVDEKWLTQALRLPLNAHVQEMCEGNIEALAQTSGVPNSGLADAARRCGATLIRLDTEEVKTMVRERPYYTSVTIPKGTYIGQADDIPTFGVMATLVATADLSDAAAYSMVRAIFEGMTELEAQVPVLRGLAPRDMISAGLSAPLHPGAERYYRERGFMTPKAAMKTAALASLPAALATSSTTPEPTRVPTLALTSPDTPAPSAAGAATPAAANSIRAKRRQKTAR